MKKTLMIISIVILVITGCNKKENYKKLKLPEGIHRIIVKEHKKAAGYTYILADDNGKEQWLAILEMPIENGDTFYYSFSAAVEMTNFKSKTLDKTFKNILFINNISESPNMSVPDDALHKKPEVKKNIEIKIKPLKDGKTIASLYKMKKQLNKRAVNIRGVVVKYNPNILNKNWIHIQDGTSYDEKNDILITTKDKAEVGDTVIVKGVLALDKDFGAGYFYDVLIENASVKVENKKR